MRKKISVLVIIAIVYALFYCGVMMWGKQFAIADELPGPFDYSWITQHGWIILISMAALLTLIGLLLVAYNVYHPEKKKSWKAYIILIVLFCIIGAGIIVTAEKELEPYMSQLKAQMQISKNWGIYFPMKL